MTGVENKWIGPGRLAFAKDVVLEKVSRTVPVAHSVTVAVSLYNYAQFIDTCLNSVQAQTHGPLELIVVDDASGDDNSLAVAEAWLASHAERFERVLLLRHRRNQGPAAARNTAFLNTRGRFVFVMDADNMLYPRAIARLHEVLQESECAAAYSQLEFFGAEQRLGHADVWSPERLKRGNYVDAMALVCRQAWEKVGGYSDMEAWADYDFWCKFVEQKLSAAFVPEILCRYRVHGASMLRAANSKIFSELTVRMLRRHPWLELDQWSSRAGEARD